jgi:hypothetical protein
LQRDRCLAGGNGRDQFKPRAHRPLWIIFVRFGITKIHEDTVAHVLGDEAAEATLLIGRYDFAQILGVHAG